MSQRGPRKSNLQKSQKSSQSEEEDSITSEVVDSAVKAVLTLDHTKRPIKQSDIIHHLPVKVKRKMLPKLWEEVQKKLDVLGMTLTECTSTTANSFLLISKNLEAEFMHKFATQKERADRTLLILILAYIFMKEGMVHEDDLFRHLSNLKIQTDSGSDDYFGDVKKKVQGQFAEQFYLSRTVLPDQEGTQVRWGERATLEIPLIAVLQFVCKIGYDDKVEPKQWVSQYERVQNA